MLRQFLDRALRLGQTRGPSAAAIDRLGGRALRLQVHIAAVIPRASRSDVYYRGFGVGQKWSMADMCRSKNTPPTSVLNFTYRVTQKT